MSNPQNSNELLRDCCPVAAPRRAIEVAATVGINEGLISTRIVPFGDVKESGVDCEGPTYGIENCLGIKYLCMGGI